MAPENFYLCQTNKTTVSNQFFCIMKWRRAFIVHCSPYLEYKEGAIILMPPGVEGLGGWGSRV